MQMVGWLAHLKRLILDADASCCNAPLSWMRFSLCMNYALLFPDRHHPRMGFSLPQGVAAQVDIPKGQARFWHFYYSAPSKSDLFPDQLWIMHFRIQLFCIGFLEEHFSYFHSTFSFAIAPNMVGRQKSPDEISVCWQII